MLKNNYKKICIDLFGDSLPDYFHTRLDSNLHYYAFYRLVVIHQTFPTPQQVRTKCWRYMKVKTTIREPITQKPLDVDNIIKNSDEPIRIKYVGVYKNQLTKPKLSYKSALNARQRLIDKSES